MATISRSLSPQELVEESRRLRQEFEENVVKLQTTMEKTRAAAATQGIWRDDWKAAPAMENGDSEAHLLDDLTRREVEVLRLIAEGRSSKEIATELGMAFRTAVCHRYRIFQKLKVHETASVVRLAVRAGLVRA